MNLYRSTYVLPPNIEGVLYDYKKEIKKLEDRIKTLQLQYSMLLTDYTSSIPSPYFEVRDSNGDIIFSSPEIKMEDFILNQPIRKGDTNL